MQACSWITAAAGFHMAVLLCTSPTHCELGGLPAWPLPPPSLAHMLADVDSCLVHASHHTFTAALQVVGMPALSPTMTQGRHALGEGGGDDKLCCLPRKLWVLVGLQGSCILDPPWHPPTSYWSHLALPAPWLMTIRQCHQVASQGGGRDEAWVRVVRCRDRQGDPGF